MSLVVGRLLAQLDLDDGQYRKGMADARSTMQRVDQQANTTSQQVRKVGTSMQQTGTQAAQGMGRARSAMDQTAQSANKLRDAGDFAKKALAGIGIGVSLGIAIRQMGDAIQAARQLGAQTNQLTILFGGQRDSITAWGKTAADTMRMSQREAQGAAIQFATFGKAAGLSGEKLASFSKQQTKLAADMASFFAISPEQAITALGSAYAGQSEVMRQYGVLIDDATLKQVAHRHGIAGLKGDLTAQQKVQATYYAIQEQLVHVNGDVARSNGRYGDSLKNLKARYEETQAEIGNRMIPITQSFVDLMAGPGLTTVGGAANMIAKLGTAFASLPTPIQAALAGIITYRLAQRFASDQTAAFGGKLAGLGTAFTNLGQTATVQTANGTVAMGRFGSAVANVGNHIPVLARMQTAFVNAAIGAQRFPHAAGAAAASMAGLRAAGSGLMAAMGGPWGLAIAGASAGVMMWMQAQEKARRKVEEHRQRVKDLSAEINKNTGELTQQGKALITKRLSDDGLLSTIKANKDLTVSVREYTDAATGNVKANKDVTASLEGQIEKSLKASKGWDDIKDRMDRAGMSTQELIKGLTGTDEELNKVAQRLTQARPGDGIFSVRGLKSGMDQTGRDAVTLANFLNQMNAELEESKKKQMEMAEAGGDVAVSFDGSQKSVGAMSKAMADFRESTDGAQAKVDGLAKALQGLTDDALTREEALQSWSDNLRAMAKSAAEFAGATVDARGHIDVTTEAGSKLQDAVRKQGDDYKKSAASAYEYALAQGQTVAQALDAVRAELGPMREKFIAQQVAMGRSREEAQKMADVYLGMPKDIVMRFNTEGVTNAVNALKEAGVKAKSLAESKVNVRVVENTDQVRAKLDQLKVKYTIIDGKVVITDNSPDVIKALNDLGVTVNNLPAGWINITDTAPEVIQRMKDLGLTVRELPDGKIVVDASTAEASRKIGELTKTETKRIKVTIDKVDGIVMSGPATGSATPGRASGGPIVGPGGPRSDDVLFWGSNGEWVHQAASVDYYGRRFMDDINHRRIPKGMLPMRADGGPLGPGKAPEDGLQPNAIRASRIVSEKWPQIQSIGGRRDDPYPDHPSGQALDIMIPDPFSERGVALGNEIVDFLMGHADDLGVESMIWQQRFIPAKGTPNMMEDRGSPTQNHMDHIHLLTKAGELAGGGDVGSVPGGIDMGGDYNSYSGSGSGDDGGNYSFGGSSSGTGVIPNARIPGVQNVYVVGGQLSGSGSGSGRSSSSGRSSYSGGGSRGSSSTGPSASQMQGYSDNIDKLNRDKERAAEDERVKQMRLDELRASGKAKPSQIAAAENALAKARDRTQTITDKIEQAETKLGEAKEKRQDARERRDEYRSDRYSRLGDSRTSYSGKQSKDYVSPADQQRARDAAAKYKRDLERAEADEKVKQMRLDELKASGTAKESQIAAAENALNKAKDRTLTITEKLRAAEDALGTTRHSGMPGRRRGGEHVANFSSKYFLGMGPTQLFRAGGTIPGSGSGDKIPLLGEPGEEIIRKRVAERPGIRRFLKQLNAGQVAGFQGGGTVGFGGYTETTSDAMKPRNFYDWLSLGVGGAATAATTVAPYVDMLATGQVNFGNLAPTVDTKANSFPTLESALSEIGGQLQEQLAQILRALLEGKNIRVVIQDDQGNSPAGMFAMTNGM